MDKQIIKELKEGTEPEVFGEALAFLEKKGGHPVCGFQETEGMVPPPGFFSCRLYGT